MAILNYTTSIAVEKTASEIHGKLVRAKADAIMNGYKDGILTEIQFRLTTPHGAVHFKLTANVQGVYMALKRNGKVPQKLKTQDQAAKVAWRICKDWIEAQLAMVESDMASMAEVFLPYAVTSNGQTVYEKFERGGVGTLGIAYQGGAA